MEHSRNSNRKDIKFVVVALILIAVIVTGISLNQIVNQNNEQAQVLGGSSNRDVVIGAKVSTCILTIITRPERRIPPVNNWGTELKVDVYSPSNAHVIDTTVTSNNLGVATLDLCAQGIYPDTGLYDFHIKGKSHLRVIFSDISSFDTVVDETDFTYTLLLAGETSPIFDNKINSLDISTQISTLFSADDKNDLNQDGLVNSLDLSNTITNFFLLGD